MLIRHLDFFVTLAETRHFGRAAELCGISQPALSLAIRKLEDDLGSSLILRGQRFMGLTPDGEKVLVWGRQILAGYGNLRDDLSGRRKGGLTGQLRLGVIASAMPLLPLFSARFEERNPMASIAVTLLPPEGIADALADFTIDGGLTWIEGGPSVRSAASGPVITSIPLRQDRLIFACRSDHPFASAPVLSWRDAATQPLCLTPDALAGPLAARGLKPAIRCASLDAVLAHLRAGLWCAVVPESFRQMAGPGDDLAFCSLTTPEVAPTLGLRLALREPQSPLVQALHDVALSLQPETAELAEAPG